VSAIHPLVLGRPRQSGPTFEAFLSFQSLLFKLVGSLFLNHS
jgi:hypothetical protein